jgi:predicted GIY-YIG superfamily endonuclease
MYHVYIITSQSNGGRYYIGFSFRPTERLQEHKDGKNPSTASFGPWRFAAVFSFRSAQQARRFERYLKDGSGRAFLRRHVLNYI